MAGHARYTSGAGRLRALPASLDALLSLATAGLFAAKWTTRIEAEWIGALERQRPELAGRLVIRRDAMRDAVPDWEVPASAWEPLVNAFTLPDARDRHVLAAAVAGHADCIVTSNLRHFPDDAVRPYGVEVVDPDRFVVNQWDLDPLVAMAAAVRGVPAESASHAQRGHRAGRDLRGWGRQVDP